MGYDSSSDTAGAPPPESVLLNRRPDGVLILSLHAPRKRNALSGPVRQQLKECLASAMKDRDVRAIVLTGSGDIFSAGGDISGMGQPIEAMMERLHLLHDVIRLILRGPKPVIAAVNGPAFGAGWSLALACDWVVCTPAARFSAAFARMGLVPDCAIQWTLPRRIGERRAAQHFIRANVVSADEALTQGIVDEITDGSAVEAAVKRINDLTQTAPLSLGEIKAFYADDSLDVALARESAAQQRAFRTEDHAEAVAAFRTRRPAMFQGR